MLRIRSEQISALRTSLGADTVLRYLEAAEPARLRKHPRTDRIRLVTTALERAGMHGLERPLDLCRFAQLELLHGPRFDAACAWAEDILALPDLTPSERVDELMAYHHNYLAD